MNGMLCALDADEFGCTPLHYCTGAALPWHPFLGLPRHATPTPATHEDIPGLLLDAGAQLLLRAHDCPAGHRNYMNPDDILTTPVGFAYLAEQQGALEPMLRSAVKADREGRLAPAPSPEDIRFLVYCAARLRLAPVVQHFLLIAGLGTDELLRLAATHGTPAQLAQLLAAHTPDADRATYLLEEAAEAGHAEHVVILLRHGPLPTAGAVLGCLLAETLTDRALRVLLAAGAPDFSRDERLRDRVGRRHTLRWSCPVLQLLASHISLKQMGGPDYPQRHRRALECMEALADAGEEGRGTVGASALGDHGGMYCAVAWFGECGRPA